MGSAPWLIKRSTIEREQFISAEQDLLPAAFHRGLLRRQKRNVNDSKSANQDGTVKAMIASGQAADFFEEAGHGRRQDGDAKNHGGAICGKRDGRKFAEASEELLSLGFVERNKFGGAGFSRDRREIALVALEHGFVAGRLDSNEPGATSAGNLAPRAWKRAAVPGSKTSSTFGSQRRVYKQAAELEGAGRIVKSDDEHLSDRGGKRERAKVQASDDRPVFPASR